VKAVQDPDAARVSADLVARPVLKDIKVLAIDQTLEPGLEGAMPANTVTLEVTPAGALAVGVASQRGALALSLIGREEKPTLLEPVMPRAPKQATVIAPPPSTTTTVRVINGMETTTVTAPVAQGQKNNEGNR
jgi:pilus assembly protein CpaB